MTCQQNNVSSGTQGLSESLQGNDFVQWLTNLLSVCLGGREYLLALFVKACLAVSQTLSSSVVELRVPP